MTLLACGGYSTQITSNERSIKGFIRIDLTARRTKLRICCRRRGIPPTKFRSKQANSIICLTMAILTSRYFIGPFSFPPSRCYPPFASRNGQLVFIPRKLLLSRRSCHPFYQTVPPPISPPLLCGSPCLFCHAWHAPSLPLTFLSYH